MSGAVPVLPLACHPYPVPAVVVKAIAEAKAYLCQRDGIDFKVQISEAVPGSPTRVLAFRGPPPFLSNASKLRNWQDPVELRGWLEWVLDEEKPVTDGFTDVQWLGQYLPGIREVTDQYTQYEFEREMEEAEINGRPVRFQ